MTVITLDVAESLIASAFRFGVAHAFKPLSVVVTDAGGYPIAFARQDGASAGRFKIALGKVSGAIFLGVPSRTIGEMAAERPTFVASLGQIAHEGVVPAAGGVLIADDAGQVIGAIGITGDTSDNDEACALAALSEVGLSVPA